MQQSTTEVILLRIFCNFKHCLRPLCDFCPLACLSHIHHLPFDVIRLTAPPSPPLPRAVPGKMYEVKEYFLEDALRDTAFTSPAMARAEAELRTRQALSSWTEHAAERPLAGAAAALDRPSIPAPFSANRRR